MQEKSNIIIALNWFGSHILGVLVGLLISFSFVTFMDNKVLYTVIGILAVFAYMAITGAGGWKLGQDDLNKVKFNRRSEDLFRGFKIGFIECIPLILLSIALILAKAEILPNFYVVYKLLNGHMLIIINIIDGTFKGISTAYLTQVSWGAIIGVSLLSFFPMIVSGVNYILGYKDIMIMDKLMYKKK